MAVSSSTFLLAVLVVLVFARPAHAFGAGNIASVSAVEGVNCELCVHVLDLHKLTKQ